VPDSEFSDPTLMVGPEVSTHDSVPTASVSPALLPQPASSSPVTATTLPTASVDRFPQIRPGPCMNSLSVNQPMLDRTLGAGCFSQNDAA